MTQNNGQKNSRLNKALILKIEGMPMIINIQDLLFQVYIQIINIYIQCMWWGFNTYELLVILYLTQCFQDLLYFL